MKIAILSLGGMGAISLSKIIAQIAINSKLSVKSTEIHGMAKKGGLVEIHMKIDEVDLSPFISKNEADFIILFDAMYKDYALYFGNNIIGLTENDKNYVISKFKDIKFANSFLLGRFIGAQSIFTKNDALKILENFKNKDENIMALEDGFNDI